MPLLTLLRGAAATGGGGTGGTVLQFVDSTGVNPLPAGVIVSLTASGAAVAGPTMLQAGGVAPIPLQNGTFQASFSGTQAPIIPVTFASTGNGTTVVTVPNYQSPVYSAAGYALEGIAHLPKFWFQDPSGESQYPQNVGQGIYALMRGLGRALAAEDDLAQQVLGAMRMQSCVGSQIDSWAYDFFQGTFYRFAQYGETDAQFIARIEAIFATPKNTIAGLQAIINVFWPWIILQFGTSNLAEDTTLGGEDTAGGEDVASSGNTQATGPSGLALGENVYGGEDTGQQFEDAPGPGILPPVPIVFDAQSNPTLAAILGLAPPQFAVYRQYPNYSDSLMHAIISPSQILTQLVNAWHGAGTVPVYASNR